MPRLSRFALAVSAAFLFGVAVSHWVPTREAHAALPVAVDGQALPSLAPMLEKVTPAVVNISSKTHVRLANDPLMNDPFFRQFFGVPNMPRERVQQSLGSGVIVDAAKGYVLTNNHVVQGADDIGVTLHDGRELKAKIVGTDPDTDLAVIQIPAENLTALPLADSAQLRMGDFVVAVGDPFGIGESATSGIVSGLGRKGLGGRGFQNFIQTDASINPGNSGGALVNLRGELVGINSSIITPSGGSVGIGFAIPANLAGDVLRQLVKTGAVKRGSLGVEAQNLTPELAGALGVAPGRGAVVTRVQADSPADTAGIKPGDVITALNGNVVADENDLHNAEGLLPVGSAVELKLLRDGKPLALNTKLTASELAGAEGQQLDARVSGAAFVELGERQRQQGLGGASIARIAGGSRAEGNGLKAGDIVIAVNQVDLRDLTDLKTLLQRHPRQLLLTVVRGRNAFIVQCQ